MIALLLSVASAGELGDLARLGEPAMVMSCESFEAMASIGQLAGIEPPPGVRGPVHAAVFSEGAEVPGTMVMEFSAAEATREAMLAESTPEVRVEPIGERMRLYSAARPVVGAGDPTTLALRALQEDRGEGCVAAGVLGSFSPIPGLPDDTVVSFSFTGWDAPVVGGLDFAAHPVLGELLDGRGEGPKVAPSSVYQFESAFQLHGTLVEAVVGMASLDAESIGPMMMLIGALPRRLEVARGAMVGFDEGGRDWGAVVPLGRPATAKKVRKKLVRLIRRAELPHTVLADDRVRISPFRGPPILVGLRDGLVVASTRDDVVQDVLAGAGEPWMAPAEDAYGLRMRVPMGRGTLRTEDGTMRFSMTLDPDAMELAGE